MAFVTCRGIHFAFNTVHCYVIALMGGHFIGAIAVPDSRFQDSLVRMAIGAKTGRMATGANIVILNSLGTMRIDKIRRVIKLRVGADMVCHRFIRVAGRAGRTTDSEFLRVKRCKAGFGGYDHASCGKHKG
jgi:hypothetical protein